MLDLVPTKELIFAILEVFLPAIIALLVFLKSEKDGIIAELVEAKQHMVEAFDYLEDSIELTLEGLKMESEDGRVLSDSEVDETLATAAKALASLKEVKTSLIKAVPFRE
jgi:hypothetical protein